MNESISEERKDKAMAFFLALQPMASPQADCCFCPLGEQNCGYERGRVPALVCPARQVVPYAIQQGILIDAEGGPDD